MATILLAEDHPHVRSALQLLVEQKLGWQVCAIASDVLALLAAAGRSCPDIILLDAELAGLPAWSQAPTPHRLGDLVCLVLLLCPNARLVALSSVPESRAAVLSAGAHAFVSKNDPPEELLYTLETMLLSSHTRIVNHQIDQEDNPC